MAAEVKVIHPTYLKEKFHEVIDGENTTGIIRSSLGNYGDFNYGTTIRGRLHYPLRNQWACDPFVIEDFYNEHLEEARKHGQKPILLINRGKCHFTKKSQNV